MSVFTFMKVDVEAQVEEIRNYLKKCGSKNISSGKSKKDLDEELEIVIDQLDILFTNIKDSDLEVILNSLVSVFISISDSEKSNNLITKFCKKLLECRSQDLNVVIVQVLNLLFKALPKDLPIRYLVYYSMIEASGKVDMIETVFSSVKDMEKALGTCKPAINQTQFRALIRLILKIFLASNERRIYFEAMEKLLDTYTDEDAAEASADAKDYILEAIKDPNTNVMDHMLLYPAIKKLEGEKVFELFNIFVSGKLTDYMVFYEKNKNLVEELDLNHEMNLTKMRSLTLLDLAMNKNELTFKEIQKATNLNAASVEELIISAMRLKLISARINEHEKTVFVMAISPRVFEQRQWQEVRDVLSQWQTNLSLVKDSLHTIVTAPLTPAGK